ncbi:hypothetical protein M0802_014440 [Mischocyttarus mexicanus]|nr:hypothetical protein M0802_014440 [Mischocyttarus mexicanus]
MEERKLEEEEEEFQNTECRLCGRGEETLEHIWVCIKAKEVIKGRLVKEIEELLGLVGIENGLKGNLVELLKGELSIELCKYSREFKKKARENMEEEKGTGLGQ